MLHIRRVLTNNKSQGKSCGVESGWMDNCLKGGLVLLCSIEGLLKLQVEDL